jgi:lipooligosaccharide transport system ATP-binding protein
MAVVSANLVAKSFGASHALNDLSFSIQSGECFGLLGPNGAGKSTMIKLIYGVMQRTSGNLSVLGFDPTYKSRQLRQHIGVVLQEDALDEAMSVRENMLMFCQFHGIPRAISKERVDELLEFMALTPKADAGISTLSGGMRRRLAFVRSLLARPKLLILDEPTTGLDPAVRQLLWQKIQELKRAGTTILLTTHYMDEAEILCDRLVVIDQGRIQAEGSPKELIERHCSGYVAYMENQSEHSRLEAASLHDIAVLVKNYERKPALVRPSNLEDVFLKLTGRNLNV